MRHRAFQQVDVFTDRPFLGNPVAVVLDGEGLDTAQMQRIAAWTNLSETTFVLPATEPGADWLLRIFTPGGELPFAGHPTIGTAHALLEAGRVQPRDGALVQQCAAGLVPLQIDTGADGQRRIAFTLPPTRETALDDGQLDALDRALGQPVLRDPRPRVIDVGPRWLVAQMADAAAVLALRPDFAEMARQDAARGPGSGVIVFGAHDPQVGGHAGAQVELRAFMPAAGVPEDPVCGSGNGCMAVFVRDTGQTGRFGARFISTQGRALGRDGQVALGIADDGAVTVGGQAVTVIEGRILA